MQDLSQLLLDIAALDRDIGSRLLAAHQNSAAELTLHSVTSGYPGTGNIPPERAQAAVASAGAIVAAVRREILDQHTGG